MPRNGHLMTHNCHFVERNSRFVTGTPLFQNNSEQPKQKDKPNNSMISEFANRQNMHLAVQRLLSSAEFKPVWLDQPPVAFTALVGQLAVKVNDLTVLIASQQAATTGFAEDKAREEQELESIAHEISQALAGWFESVNRQADAARIDLSLSAWQRMRDTELIAKARLLHQDLNSALATNAAELADYGLELNDAIALAKETADLETIIASPAAAISGRKALTSTLRPKFREVGELLGRMDRLVLRFRKTADGKRFADTWQATRIIRDLGQAAPAQQTPPANNTSA